MAHGQEAIILGFPAMNNYVFNETMPFVLSGRVSLIASYSDIGKANSLRPDFLVDRHVPGGMSGSPVVVRNFQSGELQVIGVATQVERYKTKGGHYEPHFYSMFLHQ